MNRWCFYVLECGDGSLYAGVTNNFIQRLARHKRGDGAKYTRSRLPVRPRFRLYSKSMNRSYAQVIEARFKKLSREGKKRFMEGHGRVYFELTRGLGEVCTQNF